MPASAKHKKKSVAIQSRHRKLFYLPLERALADQVILQFRMAIEVVRSGHADKAAARKLLQVTLVTGFINEAGFGMIEQSIIVDHKVKTTGFSRSALAAKIRRTSGGAGWNTDTAATLFFRSSITLCG
jgi:hypothetical protein